LVCSTLIQHILIILVVRSLYITSTLISAHEFRPSNFPLSAPLAVRAALTNQMMTSRIVKTVDQTLKAAESMILPNCTAALV